MLAKSFTQANKKVGNLLLKLRTLDPQQFEKAMAQAETSHQRIEDTVVELGMTTEPDLLKALATHYKTRFVSTERLSKADIGRSTLEMVPRQVAETFQVFPVMFDPQVAFAERRHRRPGRRRGPASDPDHARAPRT